MRNLCCILILMVPVLLQAQPYYGTHNGDYITDGQGNYMIIHEGDIPTAPEDEPVPPPNPRPDPDDYIDSIWAITFESKSADAQYIDSEINTDFTFGGDVPTDLNWIHGGGSHKPSDYNLSIIEVDPLEDGTGGTTMALKSTMDEGEYNLSGAVTDTDAGGGMRIYAPCSTERDTVIGTYNACLHPGMDFVYHGKFPALQGGEWEAWKDDNDGFSTTFTWLGDYDGDPEGSIECYIVGATGSDTTSGRNGTYIWGYGLDASDTLILDVTDSTWINFTIVVIMSDANTANGEMQWYYNGRIVAKRTSICTRGASNIYADQFGISWFYGGTGSEFATEADEWALWDDFWLCAPNSTNGIGVISNPPAGDSLNYLPNWDIENGRRWDYDE